MAQGVADPDRRPEESALLERLRAGDAAAFEELVHAHAGRLRATTRRVLANDADADDCVQDAFVAAFAALSGFEGGSALGTWLHRIAVNQALMKLRARTRRREESLDGMLPEWRRDGHHATRWGAWTDTSGDPVAREETRAFVRSSIDRLPDIHRAVLVLRDVEGWSTAETAAALAISEDAAKVRLHRARQALRFLLDPHFREGQP